MTSILKNVLFVLGSAAFCQTAIADAIYNVTLDTAPLVGHPAGPFYVYAAFTDGSGIGDMNNTVKLSNFTFGGGSALGSPVVLGGTIGSLETGVTITDSSFFSFFAEQFAPGLLLSFSLDITLNDEGGSIPDRFTLFILDSSQVPVPTQAPSGDYFFGVDLHSTGPIFDVYGSDPSRALSAGNPVSIPSPTIVAANSTPEPSTVYLAAGALVMLGIRKHRSHLRRRS